MLTGEPPYTGATAQAVLARKLQEQPQNLHTGRPEVPTRVEQAVLRALEQEPARRPATAGLLAQMLIQ